MALTSEQWKSLEDMAQQIGQETIANGLGSPEAQATGAPSYNQNASPRERYNQLWEIPRQQAAETSERRKERSESVRSNFLSTMNQIQEKQSRIPETSATPAPGSVQAENLEFLSQYQKENSLLSRLKKAGQAALSGLKEAVASNTDAQRALYEAGQSGREMRMQEDLKDLEERLAEAQRAYGQLKEQVAAGNRDFTERDVQDKADQIKQLEVQISAYKKAPEAQRGATEETSKIADEVKKSAEKDIERIKKNAGRFERFGIDIVSGLAQLAGDRAIGGLLGTTTATPALVARAFGGATQQARQGGGTIGQQIAYGSAVATVEAITEKLADGLAGAYGSGAADDIAEEVIRRLAKSPAGQTALRTLYGMGSEFAEEFVSSAANPTLRSIYNGKTVGQNYSEESVVDWLYDGMIAAATSLVSGTPERMLRGQDARANALNESISSIYEQMNEKPGVKQAVNDRDILKSIRGGKDYGNLSIGDQASEAMEALRGITPESVRAGQLSEARNRLFEMQQQRGGTANNRAQEQSQTQITPRSAGTQQQQENRSIIVAMLDRGRVSNTQANAIINDPGLADAFKELTGIDLSGTIEEKRQQIRDAVRSTSANRFDSEALARQAAEQAEAEEAEQKRQEQANAELAAHETQTGETTTPSAEQPQAATAAEPEPAPEASQPVETASAAPEPAPQPGTDGTQSEQSAGTIHASEQTTAERTNGTGNERERNMSRNLRGNEEAEPDLRNSFEENRDLYTQLTNAEVAAKAAEIIGKGYDAAKNDIYEKIGQAKAGAKLAPEYAVAGYHLANEMVRRGEVEAARELCADIAAELTYAGQVGQIGRLILAADPSIRIRTVERLVKKLNDGLSNRQKAKNVQNGVGTETGNIKVSDEALQKYAAAETDEAANKALNAIEQEIAEQIPATFRDKFTALRYLNMLGNLKTQGRNIVGNAAMMTATNIKYLTQHVIELARAAATGGKAEVNTALNTSKELRQQAAADFEANIDEIKGEAKYADVGRQATKGIQDKRQIFGTTGNKLWDNTIGRGLEAARKATNWAMEIGDEIFLRQVYVRSFAGWMKAHGITDVNNASAEQVSAAREFAKKEAQEATFHDSNQFSEFVTSIDASWDKGHSEKVNKIGAAGKMITQGIMPFRKTPANVAVRAFEYSPVGAIGTIYEAIQAKKGNASAADVINSAAKNLTGTALFSIGMLLAAAGRARASGDDEDKKLNNFKKLQGEMDYSIKVGDKYISLSQLAPMAIPFFMGVKLNELLEYNDNLLSLDSLGDILGVVSEPMLKMSMLSGVNDFLNDLSSLNGDTDALPSLVTNAAMSYLSQGLTNSLLGQLEQASERNRQTTYSDTKSKAATAFDRFLGKNQYKIGKYSAKIPGIDYNQQDYVDAWGRTQSNGGVGERAFNAFLNPTYTGKDRSTDVDEELERLYRDNKGKYDFPNVFPQKRSRSDTIGDGVVMTPDEYLSYSKESGQKKLELVREFMQSGEYKNLTDEQRAETIHNLYAFADATALQKVRDANGVTVENKYAKISDLSDVPAYLAATERFKAEAAKEGKEFNGWTNTNFEKYVSAGLKAEDLDVLAESALSDARKPAYDLMREVGMSPKEYMDAIAVMDGEKHDGQFKQADVYSWLTKNNTMSTEQKNQLWDMLGNNWKTSFSDYKPK